jgi:hypothetical protein
VTKPSIVQRIEHRRLDEVHDCVVPTCRQRARVAYHVDAPMRLAGKDWVPGDFIDLCAPHDHELRTADSDARALGYWMDGMMSREDVWIALHMIDPNEVNPLDRLREWTS